MLTFPEDQWKIIIGEKVSKFENWKVFESVFIDFILFSTQSRKVQHTVISILE